MCKDCEIAREAQAKAELRSRILEQVLNNLRAAMDPVNVAMVGVNDALDIRLTRPPRKPLRTRDSAVTRQISWMLRQK